MHLRSVPIRKVVEAIASLVQNAIARYLLTLSRRSRFISATEDESLAD